MRKLLTVFGGMLVVLLAAVLVLSCDGDGGGGNGGGDDGGDTAGLLVATWTWTHSSWTGPGLPTSPWIFTPAILEGFGASLNVAIEMRSDGTLTASVLADDVSGGDLEQSITADWAATATDITVTYQGRSITVPYALDGDQLTVTISIDQILQVTGETLPAAYTIFDGATVDATLSRG